MTRFAKTAEYGQRLLDNDYVQANLADAAANARAAYERFSRRGTKKAARDEKLRRQLREAATSATEALRALRSGRDKPEPRRERRMVVVAIVAAAGAGGVLVATNEGLRRKLFGGGPALEPADAATSPGQADVDDVS